MACYHLSLRRGGAAKATRQSDYIERRGEFGPRTGRHDLVHSASGNLPQWASGNPRLLWRASDRHERANGLSHIEYELGLPRELSPTQHVELVDRFIEAEARGRPYEVAIHHLVRSSLSDEEQPHAHVMFCNRSPDGIERTPEQFFRRFNRAHPERGGCFKVGAGVPIAQMKTELRATRARWADLQNEALAEAGHEARVDHRSHRERGVDKEPERHFGALRIKRMSDEEKAELFATRESNNKLAK